MIKYEHVYSCIRDSAYRICDRLEIPRHRVLKRYFGITFRRWFYNVLLETDCTLYRPDNYGRQKSWIITHKYWRSLHTLKDSGLPPELLLHHSMWSPKPIMETWKPTQTLHSGLSRQDCVMIREILPAFEQVYRTLFCFAPGHMQKCSEINNLVHSLLSKHDSTITKRCIKLIFHELNHTVVSKSTRHYYTNLKYIN